MIRLPRYTRRHTWILIGLLIPFILAINYILFGNRYFAEGGLFFQATAITGIIMFISWLMHTWVAVELRNRFSGDEEMLRRMAIALLLFMIMTGITLTLLFYGYDYMHFKGYSLDETKYNWALLVGVIVNIFVTVVHEVVSSFEKWKSILVETEQLKKEHMHSQLLGLKSQVSPHFLFNSLNSLSCLISENPVQAEQFLDEMSKVYRYLLRANEEQLVELGTELQFVHSYFHLLKARYGNGVELTVQVEDHDKSKLLPPLTLQILLDSIFKVNLISKDSPLRIGIRVNEAGWLEIRNNIQQRISGGRVPDEPGMANISKKFWLLCQQSIKIENVGMQRVMEVPMILHEQNHAV